MTTALAQRKYRKRVTKRVTKRVKHCRANNGITKRSQSCRKKTNMRRHRGGNLAGDIGDPLGPCCSTNPGINCNSGC